MFPKSVYRFFSWNSILKESILSSNLLLPGIFIVGAKRTAFGTFGGAFRNTSATELQTVAAVAALKEAGVSPDKVDSVVVGQVMTVSVQEF